MGKKAKKAKLAANANRCDSNKTYFSVKPDSYAAIEPNLEACTFEDHWKGLEKRVCEGHS